MAAASNAHYALAAVVLHERARQAASGAALGVADELMNWSSAAPLGSFYSFVMDAEVVTVVIRAVADGFTATKGDVVIAIADLSVSETKAQATLNGHRVSAAFVSAPDKLHLSLSDRDLTVDIHRPGGAGDAAGGGGRVTAPMHGVLLEVLVTEGEEVSAGQKLAILEAMKMQHEILATIDGKVTSVTGAVGAQTGAGDLIMEIEGDDA